MPHCRAWRNVPQEQYALGSPRLCWQLTTGNRYLLLFSLVRRFVRSRWWQGLTRQGKRFERHRGLTGSDELTHEFSGDRRQHDAIAVMAGGNNHVLKAWRTT